MIASLYSSRTTLVSDGGGDLSGVGAMTLSGSR